MNHTWLLILPILIPVIFGGLISIFHIGDERKRNVYVMSVVSLTSLLVIVINLWGPADSLVIVGFGSKMSIAFSVDGMGRLFSFMVAILWPLGRIRWMTVDCYLEDALSPMLPESQPGD